MVIIYNLGTCLVSKIIEAQSAIPFATFFISILNSANLYYRKKKRLELIASYPTIFFKKNITGRLRS